MLKIKHGDFYWGESKTVITAPGVSRRPGNQVGLFVSEGKDGNAWLLTFAYNYNGFLKNKNMKQHSCKAIKVCSVKSVVISTLEIPDQVMTAIWHDKCKLY